MTALASISQLQLLEVWEHLIDARDKKHSYGTNVAEIYTYLTMQYNPSLMGVGMSNTQTARDAYRQANEALMEICKMFQERHKVRIVYLTGENDELEFPIRELLHQRGIEPHRLHVKVITAEDEE